MKTPVQEAGFEVGTYGVVVTANTNHQRMYNLNSILQLQEDDGSEAPYWTNLKTGNLICLFLDRVRPLTKEEILLHVVLQVPYPIEED